MISNPSVWQRLLFMGGISTALMSWRERLAEHFDDFRPYLRPTDRRSVMVACEEHCQPHCSRHVHVHSDDDIVGICFEGMPKVKLEMQDILVHEIDMPKFCRALAECFGIRPEYDGMDGLPGIYQIGYYPISGVHMRACVYMLRDPYPLLNGLASPTLRSGAPLLMLGLSHHVCLPDSAALLSELRGKFLALDELVDLQDGRCVARASLQDCLEGLPQRKEMYNPDAIELQRHKGPDGVHWLVNGRDLGSFYKQENSIRAKIINILYDQIGRGWVPHKTFMNAGGWTEDTYFPEPPAPAIIQKHLTEIRKFLGVEIEFRKDRGVKFSEKIVKSRS